MSVHDVSGNVPGGSGIAHKWRMLIGFGNLFLWKFAQTVWKEIAVRCIMFS